MADDDIGSGNVAAGLGKAWGDQGQAYPDYGEMDNRMSAGGTPIDDYHDRYGGTVMSQPRPWGSGKPMPLRLPLQGPLPKIRGPGPGEFGS